MGKFSPRVNKLIQLIRDLLKADSAWAWQNMQLDAFEELHQELMMCPLEL